MKNNNPRGFIRTILPWILILALLLMSMNIFNTDVSVEYSYNDFIEAVEDGDIEEAELNIYSLTIDIEGTVTVDGETYSYVVTIPNSDSEVTKFEELFDTYGVEYTHRDASSDGSFLSILLSIVPYILMIGVMIYLMTRMSGGSNQKAFEFGNSRAKLEKDSKTKFTDFSGCDEEKE